MSEASHNSLEDVAKLAGVSTATVSRVLNNSGVVRTETRVRVLEAVQDLNYYPNAHARALAGKSSRALGLIVSNLENPFFLDIFRVLEQEAHANGYEVLVANTSYDPQWLRSSVHTMLERRVAGLALVVSEIEPATLDELQARGIRTVIYSVGSPKPNVLSIKVNYRLGIELIAEHLRSEGHRRMAFIGHHTSLAPLTQRKQAFVEVMERYAPEVTFTTCTEADSYPGGRRAVREIFASDFRPTAILCANDFMAVGVLRELRDMGLRVPEDVSVAGFDNISLSEVIFPSLTTLHVPRDLIGRKIFESLTQKEETGGSEMLIQPELVLRESTGPAPTSLSD